MSSLFNTSKVTVRRIALLLLTIKLIKNWYAALWAYLLKRPMYITFRNGTRGYFDSKTISRILRLVRRDANLKQLPNNIFEVSIGDTRMKTPVKYMGSLEYIFLDAAYKSGIDYRGKIVLDVGAYIGDTAAYFWCQGASKIICYEPIKEFVYWLKQNVRLNGINAELYNFGISDKHGEIEVPYSELDGLVGFGGDKTIKIKTLSISEVLQRHKIIDVGKFGCPGCEQAILNLSDAELSKVPIWIIGTHNKQLKAKLLNRFSRTGFKSKTKIRYTPKFEWNLLFFWSLPVP